MPRVANAKLPSTNSIANLGFEAFSLRWQWSGATWTTRQGCPQGKRGGVHRIGVPPKGNANFAWLQHFIHHLAPQGMGGIGLT